MRLETFLSMAFAISPPKCLGSSYKRGKCYGMRPRMGLHAYRFDTSTQRDLIP